MVHNINDVIRNEIYNKSLLDFIIDYDTLSNKEKQNILSILLLDNYKIAINHDRDKINFFKINIESILDLCEEDKDLLINMLRAGKTFYSLDTFSKCLLFEIISKHDSGLIDISKFHILDKLTYATINDVEHYKKYYIEFMEKHKNKDASIIELFIYKIINLKYEDEIKYKEMLLEFMQIYYKWKTYMKENNGEFLLEVYDNVYLDILNNNNINDIFEFLETNINFLEVLVDDFFFYTTTELEIEDSVVDEYYESNTSEQVKQKFKTNKRELS